MKEILIQFLYLVQLVREQAQMQDVWVDGTDPSSGFPLYSPRGTSIYPDVDGSVQMLKYSSEQAGCCRIVIHPKWGTRNYPCTLFTTATPERIELLLDSVLNGLSAKLIY